MSQPEDWGGRQHFDYCNAYPDFDLERIAQYAAERRVSLWMHNETEGSIFEYEVALDSAFSKYENPGIHTVKTGYAGGMPGSILHHSQRVVQHYQKVVEKAACHKLMINAHEPIKETGIRRTWPNMMTREGAKGMEWNAWSRGNDSEYLCTIPFTRLRKAWNGDYIVIARRTGDRFFLGAGTDSTPRHLSVPLDFLKEGITYESVIYADDSDAPVVTQPDGTSAPDKRSYVITRRKVSSEDALTLFLAADGGAAVSFTAFPGR